jgi:hypothetical protein
MARPEIIERRLRIASFLFVAAGILLTFGSLVMGGQILKGLTDDATLMKAPVEIAMPQLLAIVATERIVQRSLFMAMLFTQLGTIFLMYLMLSKLRNIEDSI